VLPFTPFNHFFGPHTSKYTVALFTVIYHVILASILLIINFSFNKLCILQNFFTFHFTNQCHSIFDNKQAYNKEIRRQTMQRTVIRQGSNTGLNYLQHLYLQCHRSSISRLRSHVMADLTKGRMSNQLYNRQQLIPLNFKNNILLCQKTRSCFFHVFPHRPQWNLETQTHMHIQRY